MKRTLTRSWNRVRTLRGELYYWTPISQYIISQVWRDGSYWRWAIVGFVVNESQERQPFIWKTGTGGSMNEACYYCEQAIPTQDGEQLQMVLP